MGRVRLVDLDIGIINNIQVSALGFLVQSYDQQAAQSIEPLVSLPWKREKISVGSPWQMFYFKENEKWESRGFPLSWDEASGDCPAVDDPTQWICTEAWDWVICIMIHCAPVMIHLSQTHAHSSAWDTSASGWSCAFELLDSSWIGTCIQRENNIYLFLVKYYVICTV